MPNEICLTKVLIKQTNKQTNSQNTGDVLKLYPSSLYNMVQFGEGGREQPDT